jgi:CheY-specific phosphatase CheX
MSLSKSLGPPSEAAAALKDAFADVCENSFFAYVEPCEPRRFAELVKSTMEAAIAETRPGGARAGRRDSIWLKAAVAFNGSFAGAIEVILPESLATGLVSSLLGADPDNGLPEHQMFDGVGEFANMVCGAWLTTLSDREAFELRAPVVTRMASDWTPVSDPSWKDQSWHLLAVNDQPIRVRFRPAAERA